jgi:hypothetical protein
MSLIGSKMGVPGRLSARRAIIKQPGFTRPRPRQVHPGAEARSDGGSKRKQRLGVHFMAAGSSAWSIS